MILGTLCLKCKSSVLKDFFASSSPLCLTCTNRLKDLGKLNLVKLRCDERFTHAFTACSCVFKEITLVGSNQGNYFENENACSKRTLKTTVATHP